MGAISLRERERMCWCAYAVYRESDAVEDEAFAFFSTGFFFIRGEMVYIGMLKF